MGLLLVQRKLAQLKAAYQKRYGEVIFEVSVRQDKRGSLSLHGSVLLPKQKAALERVLRRCFRGVIHNHVQVLKEDPWPRLGWGRLDGVHWTDVWRVPCEEVEYWPKLEQNKYRSTQIQTDDPAFALLWEFKSWYLVSLYDGTIGWTRKAVVKRSIAPLNGLPERPQRDLAHHSRWLFKQSCDQYLGVPYLLGGTTVAGIDCSGLTQRIYRQAFQTVIPKKSTDQFAFIQAFGQPKKTLIWGDLVFFERRNKKRTAHVGILYDDKGGLIMHSSLKNRVVEIEPLASLKQSYRLMGGGGLPCEHPYHAKNAFS